MWLTLFLLFLSLGWVLLALSSLCDWLSRSPFPTPREPLSDEEILQAAHRWAKR